MGSRWRSGKPFGATAGFPSRKEQRRRLEPQAGSAPHDRSESENDGCLGHPHSGASILEDQKQLVAGIRIAPEDGTGPPRYVRSPGTRGHASACIVERQIEGAADEILLSRRNSHAKQRPAPQAARVDQGTDGGALGALRLLAQGKTRSRPPPLTWASGGRRRSEDSLAVFENLRRVDGGDFLYMLASSKTNHNGKIRPKDVNPVVESAAEALEAWLKAGGINSGALLRRILKNGKLGTTLGDGGAGHREGALCARRRGRGFLNAPNALLHCLQRLMPLPVAW